MRIVLMRHGKPDIAGCRGVSAHAFATWLRAYDAAGVACDSFPDRDAVAVAARCESRLCSNLQRSISTIKTVCPDSHFTPSPLFRELELPHGPWHWPRVHSSFWGALLRVMWYFGYTHQAETREQAQCRARAAAQRLIREAEEHNSVVLAGHYFINRMIARQLVEDGWDGPTWPNGRHWAVNVYDK